MSTLIILYGDVGIIVRCIGRSINISFYNAETTVFFFCVFPRPLITCIIGTEEPESSVDLSRKVQSGNTQSLELDEI